MDHEKPGYLYSCLDDSNSIQVSDDLCAADSSTSVPLICLATQNIQNPGFSKLEYGLIHVPE